MLPAIVASWLVTPPAMAQGGNAAAAEALFQRALVELKAERYDAACPAFAESQKLDPRPGTLFAMAECEVKWGKAATASTHFADYLATVAGLPPAQRAKHKEREKLARERKQELAPQIAQLTLALPAGVTAKDVEVRLDDTPLGAPSLGVALPVDPGAHAIEVRRQGAAQKTSVTLGRGERKTVTLGTLGDGPKGKRVPDPDEEPETAPAPPPAAAAPPASSAPAKPPPGTGEPPSRATLGYVAGGLGGAGLVVGIVTGALVLQKKSVVSEHCVDTKCDREGKDAADAARPLATASTVGFGVGVVGLAVGAWLLLADGEKPPAAAAAQRTRWTVDPALGREGGAVTVRGRF